MATPTLFNSNVADSIMTPLEKNAPLFSTSSSKIRKCRQNVKMGLPFITTKNKKISADLNKALSQFVDRQRHRHRQF